MGLLVEAGHSVAVYNPDLHGNSLSALWRGLRAAKHEKADFVILEVSSDLLGSGAFEALTLDTVVVINACPEAKPLLQQASQYAVIPDDHETVTLPIAEHQIVSFGETKNADAKIDKVKLYRKGTEIRFLLDSHTPVEVATHLVGHANVRNVAAAISAAYVLGVPLDTVDEGIARAEAIPGNFEYIESAGSFMTVLDRAASEHSAELVIKSAKELTKRRLVVGLAIGEVSAEFAAKIQHLTDRLVVVTDQEGLPSSVETVASPDDAQMIAERAAKKDDMVLLVGPSFNQETS